MNWKALERIREKKTPLKIFLMQKHKIPKADIGHAVEEFYNAASSIQ